MTATSLCGNSGIRRRLVLMLFCLLVLVVLMRNVASVPHFFVDFVKNEVLVEKQQQVGIKKVSTVHYSSTLQHQQGIVTSSSPENVPAIDASATLETLLLTDGPFHGNSLEWLQGTPLSNQMEDTEFIWSQISEIDLAVSNSNSLHSIMDRTVCHKGGRFRTLSDTNWNVTDTMLVSDWAFRLTYLAIHSWHHAPARNEAFARRQHNGNPQDPPFHVKPFDFECPNAKFLITNMPRLGMGASFRLGAVGSVIAAIATGRIAVFLNSINSTNIPSLLTEELWLASCDRLDMQCAFLPTTPCVVTLEALENKTVTIPESIARGVRRLGRIPDATMNAQRYLFMETRLAPVPDRGILFKAGSILLAEAKEMVAALHLKTNGLPIDMFTVLDKALQQLKLSTVNKMHTDGYTYYNRYSMIPHAALLYILRLERGMHDRVLRQSEKILTGSGQFDPTRAIGLPIRGSDKCNRETTCLPFDTYMNLANEVWLEHFAGHDKGSVVVTTEATDVANASRMYAASYAGGGGTLSIVMNDEDVLQDTGRPRTPKYRARADDVMESTLVAMRLQFHTKFTIGNCCSNFHLVLFDLLQHGCGLSETQQCLQETTNASYHACCQWSKTEECTTPLLNDTTV